MYIQRIELKNYRGHQQLTVEFQPGMSVLAGINGAGKTSLLQAIFDGLIPAIPNLPQAHTSNSFHEPGVAYVKPLEFEGRVRFEEQFPVEVGIDAEIFGISVSWRVVRTPERFGVDGTTPYPAMHARAFGGVQGDSPSSFQSLPVIAYYRAEREWKHQELDLQGSAIERSSRGLAYRDWMDAGRDAASLQRWVVAKSLERLHAASESGIPFSKIDSDELAEIDRALRVALDTFKSMRFDFPSKKIVVEWQHEDGRAADLVAFENLSAGQRTVICLVADIARRMSLLNPHLGRRVISETEGIVLIDELDMHLHPEWQRALTRGLVKAFPKVQFIVASHSPQVIGEVPHENVILLTPEGPVTPKGSFGMTSNQVLQELMGAEVRATSVKEKLDEIGEALTRNQLNDAEQKIRELSEKAPELRELASAESLLKRKRTIGR